MIPWVVLRLIAVGGIITLAGGSSLQPTFAGVLYGHACVTSMIVPLQILLLSEAPSCLQCRLEFRTRQLFFRSQP